MYQALYRKWRPRTFDDVVGQGHITETLKRQVAAGRLSHAYLFTGTRGTGKTTCAKILARAVNCQDPQNGNPCNRCPSCLGIENGSVLDVLELDAASNNRVDDIRAILDEAMYTPATVKKRVYIVDEVHMLSAQAFNALLQILEEPPEHLMFILATTEIHKVPATIKSRCQQFAFKRIRAEEIAGRLRYVAGQEGIDLTEDGAALLARLADGGMRDALSLLDQCAGAGSRVDEGEIFSALGLAGNLETAALMDHIADGDPAAALTRLDRLYAGGKEMSALIGELAALARDLLVRKTAPQGGAGLMTGGFDEATLKRLSGRFQVPRLVQMLTRLQQTGADMARSSSRRTDAELCLVTLCDPTLDDSPRRAQRPAVPAGAGRTCRPLPCRRPLCSGAAPAAGSLPLRAPRQRPGRAGRPAPLGRAGPASADAGPRARPTGTAPGGAYPRSPSPGGSPRARPGSRRRQLARLGRPALRPQGGDRDGGLHLSVQPRHGGGAAGGQCPHSLGPERLHQGDDRQKGRAGQGGPGGRPAGRRPGQGGGQGGPGPAGGLRLPGCVRRGARRPGGLPGRGAGQSHRGIKPTGGSKHMAKGFNSRGMGGMGGNMNSMLRQAQKMQQDMLKAQEELESKSYEASAGGGVVTAVVSGRKELTQVTIDPEAVDPDDVDMLQDLIVAAVNEAMRKASDDAASQMSKLTGGLNLPF